MKIVKNKGLSLFFEISLKYIYGLTKTTNQTVYNQGQLSIHNSPTLLIGF